MILKISNGVEGWSFFECTTFHYQWVKFNAIKEDCLRLMDNEPFNYKENAPTEQRPNKQVKIIRLEPQNKQRPIVTDYLIYVLNNEGKTIDRF